MASDSRSNSPPPTAPSTAVATRTATPTKEKDEKTTTSSIVEKTSVTDESRLLTGRPLFLVFVGFLLSILLVALDQTIVATALPVIASKFDALDELTWIVTAYFLTQAGLMLTFGQILTIAKTKYVYLVCIGIFELGSLICGVAPSMEVLIFGRAVQGVGAAGVFVAILTVIAQVTRLEQRPVLLGSFGGVFALASIIGPLLGGALTEKVSWRWCFYINLPFGAISILAVIFWLPAHDVIEPPNVVGKTTLQKWVGLDWVGSVLSIGMITCLLLPLQWGGVTRPWNDKVVIALLVVGGFLIFVFVAWEFRMKDDAMMPLYMFKRRTQVGSGIEIFMIMLGFLVGTYFLPLFYQAKGRSPTESGIDSLAFMVAGVVGTAGSGIVVNKTGRYWPFLFVGPMIGAVGAGLFYTIDAYTPNPRIIGFQIILGFGLGVAFQNTMLAIQAEWSEEPEMIPQASSLLTFLQLLGGVVGIAIAGSVFSNQLGKELSQYSDISPEIIASVKQSVTAIFTVDESIRPRIIESYVKALNPTFIIIVPASAVASIASLLIKNYDLKKKGGAAMAAMA